MKANDKKGTRSNTVVVKTKKDPEKLPERHTRKRKRMSVGRMVVMGVESIIIIIVCTFCECLTREETKEAKKRGGLEKSGKGKKKKRENRKRYHNVVTCCVCVETSAKHVIPLYGIHLWL
jgi:hypothetical protein